MAEMESLIGSLWELDEDQLEVQIGSHIQAIKDEKAGGEAKGISHDPTSLDSIDVNIASRAPIDPQLLETGQQLFNRLNPLIYDLLCKPLGGEDPETQKILDEAISENYTKAAGMLAPLLMSGLGLAPAVATLLATLMIKKVANYTSTGICQTWEKTLPKAAN